MSDAIEELQSDLKANLAGLKDALPAIASAGDITKHLKNDLWPFLENIVNNMVEMDEAIEGLYENTEDILQPETAGVFATVITGSLGLVAQLRARMVPGYVETPQTRALLDKALAEHEAKCLEANELLSAITVIVDDGDDEEDEDDEDGDDDADDAGEKGAH